MNQNFVVVILPAKYQAYKDNAGKYRFRLAVAVLVSRG